MELKKMYKGQVFSPTAVITTNISATDTMIPVNDVDAFPDAPSIATIGTDVGAETIIYNSKTSSALSGCVRGVEGIAKDWEEGTTIGRNFTAKDHGDMVDNIELLAEEKLDAVFKVDVTNSDEIAIEGKALDATQNNKDIDGTLANKLDYMVTHGYVKESTRYDDADEEVLNSLSENGKYTVNLQGVPNIVDGWYNVDVTMHSPNTYGNQILKGMTGGTVNKMYFRTKEGTWHDAKVIAMQDITTITPDNFSNGWSQYNGHQQTKVIIIGNIVHLVGYVNVGVTTSPTGILTVPVYCRPKIAQVFNRWNITLRLDTDGNLILYSVASGVSQIDFSGIYWEI